MPDATTTNFGFTKPTVGGDSGTWGGLLNDNWDQLDTDLQAVKDTADAALPLAGGTLTGTVATKAVNYPRVALGNVSGALTLDLSLGNYFTLTVTGNITSIALSNVPASGRMVPIFLHMTNGGSFTITWGSAFKFPAGATPVLTVGGLDILGFVTIDGGTTVDMVGASHGVQ